MDQLPEGLEERNSQYYIFVNKESHEIRKSKELITQNSLKKNYVFTLKYPKLIKKKPLY